MSTEPHSSSPPSAGPPGVSGKRLTVGVLVALVLIGLSLGYTLWTYNEIDVARRASLTAWRAVSEHLDQRYRRAERIVAQGVDERTIAMEFGEKFRLAIDSFRTTSLFEEQVVAAERLEQLLATQDLAAGAEDLERITSAAEADIERYNQARQREKVLLEGWGGRLLDVFLHFETPRPFSISSTGVGN